MRLINIKICMATQRVIAQRSIAPSLTASLTRLISSLKAGDPIQDPSVQLGCLNESSAQNIVSQLEEAKAQGAEFLVGDGTRVGPTMQPHLIRGIKPGMHVWERENFGPGVSPLLVTMDAKILHLFALRLWASSHCDG